MFFFIVFYKAVKEKRFCPQTCQGMLDLFSGAPRKGLRPLSGSCEGLSGPRVRGCPRGMHPVRGGSECVYGSPRDQTSATGPHVGCLVKGTQTWKQELGWDDMNVSSTLLVTQSSKQRPFPRQDPLSPPISCSFLHKLSRAFWTHSQRFCFPLTPNSY